MTGTGRNGSTPEPGTDRPTGLDRTARNAGITGTIAEIDMELLGELPKQKEV